MNKTIITKIVAVVAFLFGLMTINSGGSTLFIEEVRQAAGDFVPFVLWINFILGFAYLAAGIGLFTGKAWGKSLSLAIAGITLLTYAAFGIHVALGGLFIVKTVKAMAVRSLVWVGIAFVAVKSNSSETQTNMKETE